MKSFSELLCRYELSNDELDLSLKINFMFIFLSAALAGSLAMGLLRLFQDEYIQAYLDFFMAGFIGVLFFWLTRRKAALVIIARVVVFTILAVLYVGIYTAVATVTSLIGIILLLSVAYLYLSLKEFTFWVLFYALALLFGEFYLLERPHFHATEFFVIALMIAVKVMILHISRRSKELHATYVISQAAERRNRLLGGMVSMVSHQWRQPLASITAITSKLEIRNSMRGVEPGELENELHKIENHCLKLSDQIDIFHDLFREHVIREDVNIVAFLNEVAAEYERVLKDADVLLHTNFTCEGIVKLSKADITKAIHLLMDNALEHQAKLLWLSCFEEESQVVIRLSNDGEPIAQEIQEHIFDPFFSTKDEKQSVGLGLFIAKSLVEKSLGTISLNTQQDRIDNVEFNFRFPIFKK